MAKIENEMDALDELNRLSDVVVTLGLAISGTLYLISERGPLTEPGRMESIGDCYESTLDGISDKLKEIERVLTPFICNQTHEEAVSRPQEA